MSRHGQFAGRMLDQHGQALDPLGALVHAVEQFKAVHEPGRPAESAGARPVVAREGPAGAHPVWPVRSAVLRRLIGTTLGAEFGGDNSKKSPPKRACLKGRWTQALLRLPNRRPNSARPINAIVDGSGTAASAVKLTLSTPWLKKPWLSDSAKRS